MEKTENPENSGVSESTEGETTPEEGDVAEENPVDNDTPVIETPEEEPSADSVEEPTEEEVVEPEAPAESEEPVTSEEPEGGNKVGDAESNAVEEGEEEYTVSISGFETISAYIRATATIGGEPDKSFPRTGSLTASKGKAVVVTINAKSGAKVTSVKNGDKAATLTDGTYTVSLSSLAADASIEVEAVSAYKLDTDFSNSGVTKIKLDDSLREDIGADEKESMEITSEDIAQGKDLKFTLVGGSVDADSRLNVSYKADGSSEETPITAVEETVVEGEKETKVNTYTVKQDVLADLHTIEICVEKETKIDLGTLLDAASLNNTDVNIVYWGTRKATVTEGDEKAWVEGANEEKYDPIKKAYADEDFQFKVAVKESIKNKAVTKVTKTVNGKEETIEPAEGVYTINADENITAFAIETDYTAEATNKLTYTLKEGSEEDSVVSAVITSITAGTTTATTEEEIRALLGGSNPSVTLKSGTAVTVKKADGDQEITAIEVTVTPAADYTIKKGENDKHTVDSTTGVAVYKFTKAESASSAAISEDMKIEVETEVKKAVSETGTFFMVTRDKGTEDEPKNTHISDPVVTVNDNVEAVTVSENSTEVKAYKVKKDTQTVEFKVTADAGYKLHNPSGYVGFKSINEEAAADGKVNYTVTLFASRITSTDEDAPDWIAVEEEAAYLSAEVEPGSGEEGSDKFTIGYARYTDKEGDEYYYHIGQEKIPYGSKLEVDITPNAGHHLTGVSYSMGGTDTPVTLEDDGVTVTVPEVTGKVTIHVTAEKDYELTDLVMADGSDVDQDYNTGTYEVRYDEAYLVGLTDGGVAVPAKDYKAVVKDAKGTEVKLPRIVANGKLKIDLTRANPDVAGQVITVDMVVGESVVGTYVLNVNKKTTKLTIEGVEKAEKDQRVDSMVEYTIDTDGDLLEDYNISGDAEIIDYYYLTAGNKLVVYTAALTTDEVTKTKAIADKPAVYKSATITLTSDDDRDLEASITITAQPFIEDIANKEVNLSAGAQADTVLNVTLGLDGVEKPRSGELYYELTVTPKPAQGTTLSDKLLSSVPRKSITKKGDSQSYQVQVAKSNKLGEGAGCNYEVKAKLVYDTGSKTESTKEVTSNDFATIDGKGIKYVNNLKLTKDRGFKGTLYTGQSDEIVIANVNWTADKNVTYKILSDDDIYDGEKYDAYGEPLKGLTVGQNASGQIVVKNVPTNTWLGKHTITVEGTADQTTGHEMYKSRATITVNVVKGIEDITITAPSYKIYKKDARSKATIKMTAGFNASCDYDEDGEWHSYYESWDGKKYVTSPKSKNLKWELVGADSYDDGYDTPLPDSFGNRAVTINVKNGTVTVDKKFEVSKNTANNRFCVKATAADYAGNTTVAYSAPIEITSEAISIAKLALVKKHFDEEGYLQSVEVVAVQNTNNEEIKIDATVANGAEVYALPAGVELAKEYDSSKWWNLVNNKLINPNNYSVTSSSKKVVEVNGKRLNVLTAGKRVKLTVAANDGSKTKRVLPLDLGWTGAEKDMALGIFFVDRNGNRVYDNSGKPTVFNPGSEYAKQPTDAKGVKNIAVKDITSTGATRLQVELMEGNKADGSSNSFDYADGFTNYKLTAKGGKLTYNKYGSADLVTTAKVTTLTLTIGTGRTAKKSVYTITNKAYELTNKAPKVTVKGSLYENGHINEQQVSMTVKNGKDLYVGKKSAKIEIDWSSMNAKNSDTLWALNSALAQDVIALDEKTGEIKVSFDNFGDDFGGFTPGSYKLKLTVGTGTTAENFKAETLPANVTLKVAKNKAFTFKPQTSYTIGKLDGGAILTGKSNVAKGEKTFMNFYGLRNANVNGRPNDFTHYFTINYDPINNTQRLVLNVNDPVFQEKFGITKETPLDWDSIDLTKIDKSNLTGYVTYNAWSNKKYYGIGTTGWANGVKGTTKITVKLTPNPKNGVYKPSLKYTTNKAEVLAKDNETAVVNVMSGNEYVAIKHAVVYETDQLKAGSINEKGQVLLTVKGVVAKKTYSTTMKVIPWSSAFVGTIDAIDPKTKEAEYKAAIEKYGITVKVSVLAKATAEEVTPTPDPVTVAAVVNLINEKTYSEDGWKTKAVAENLWYPIERERDKAKESIQSEIAAYLEGYVPFKGFSVKAISITGEDRENEEDWENGADVKMTVEKGGDIEYFDVPLSAVQGSLPPESIKDKLDDLIKDNLEQYKNKIERVEGINKAEYDEETNKITVFVDETSEKDVETAYAEWKAGINVEEEKADLVSKMTEAFGEDWANVASVSVYVKMSQGIKDEDDDRNIVKESPDETIADFVDRYYAERDAYEERAFQKLHKKLEEEGKDKLLFEHLVSMNVTEKVTVHYNDGREPELLDGYKLYITQSQPETAN